MTVVGILQARMGSTRLPGKVMKKIFGKPMLELQIERIMRCRKIDSIVVATSKSAQDDAIEKLCKQLNINIFRGSLNNVLLRFYEAAKNQSADHVVRLTGDCPLIDPEFIDRLIDFYFEEKCDYASNCRPPTLPDGLDAEIFSFEVLKKAKLNAQGIHQLEHVTPYIFLNPEQFSIKNWKFEEDFSGLRWTVDEIEDLAFVRKVYDAMYKKKPDFGMKDILKLIEKNSDLSMINAMHKRNAGSKKNT